jgi:N-acetylglucosaminyl-diphospho-decaprenol L-rhamnosyltransferase
LPVVNEQTMHVAVCIVGYRNADDIAACLGALAKSTYRHFEVQICENGGSNAYRALVEAVPQRLAGGQPVGTIEAPGNLGYAGGVNVCIRGAPDAEAWWVLNPDTLPDPDALEALVKRLARGDCELVGGILYGADGRVQTLGGRWRPWLARAEAIGRGLPVSNSAEATNVRLDFVSGASMLVSKAFVAAVGLMREDYFLYCEEVEWCIRGRARGMRLALAADAHILHDQGGTTGSARPVRSRPKLPVYLDERNKILVTRDCFPARLSVAAPAALLFIALRFLRRGAWRQAEFAVQGWLAGLMNKRGVPDLA